MSGLDDDALQAMLAARADRLSPNAAGEVMVGVRAEVRGPRQGAAFSVLPVLAGRTPAIGAGWAAAAMIAVIAMVIVATRPPTASPSPSAAASAVVAVSPGSSASSEVATASPSSAIAATPSRVTMLELGRALSDGSLDGRILAVDSVLRGLPTPCPIQSCGDAYQLDLVGPVVTQMRPALPVVPAAPAAGSTPLQGTFLVVPSSGSLVLVGRMEGSLANPLPWSAISGAYVPADPGAELAIQPVSGWLQRIALPCVPGSACPDGGQLTDGDPSAGAAGRAVAVTVASPALGVGPVATVAAGPFLVRTGAGSNPEVAARYDAAAIVTIDPPPVTCNVATSASDLRCLDLAQIALDGVRDFTAGAGKALGTVTSIEVDQGAYCPPGFACPTVVADRAHVVLRAPAPLGDWLVELTLGPNGGVTRVAPQPLPSP